MNKNKIYQIINQFLDSYVIEGVNPQQFLNYLNTDEENFKLIYHKIYRKLNIEGVSFESKDLTECLVDSIRDHIALLNDLKQGKPALPETIINQHPANTVNESFLVNSDGKLKNKESDNPFKIKKGNTVEIVTNISCTFRKPLYLSSYYVFPTIELRSKFNKLISSSSSSQLKKEILKYDIFAKKHNFKPIEKNLDDVKNLTTIVTTKLGRLVYVIENNCINYKYSLTNNKFNSFVIGTATHAEYFQIDDKIENVHNRLMQQAEKDDVSDLLEIAYDEIIRRYNIKIVVDGTEFKVNYTKK